MRIGPPLVAFFLAACLSQRAPVSSSDSSTAHGAVLYAAPPVPVDVSGWRDFPKLNDRRFRSKGHGYLWVDVHLEAEHRGAYTVRTAPVTPGFRIVTAGYEASEGGQPTGLTVMAKMPAGYDLENGDWYYEVLAPDGVTATMGGKLAPCIGCHRQARARDFLFDVATHDEGAAPTPK